MELALINDVVTPTNWITIEYMIITPNSGSMLIYLPCSEINFVLAIFQRSCFCEIYYLPLNLSEDNVKNTTAGWELKNLTELTKT